MDKFVKFLCIKNERQYISVLSLILDVCCPLVAIISHGNSDVKLFSSTIFSFQIDVFDVVSSHKSIYLKACIRVWFDIPLLAKIRHLFCFYALDT